MKKIPVLLACFSLLFIVASAQHINRDAFIKDSLDQYISRALTNWRIPGAAVCIIKDNKIIVMKGYGIKEMGMNDKVDKNTLFMIGSNTKAFTATALAMLQAAGKLSLDDKVTRYLPEFKLDNKTATEQATICDLLCHRLGFATYQGDFTFYNTNLTTPQIIEKLRYVKAAYPFRSTWGYTNAAFATAGEIFPWVAGKTWDYYISTNIFLPLGMDNTLPLSKQITGSTNRTVPHTLVDGRLSAIPYAQIDGLAAAGSISSSVNDLSKWVMALLNDGKVGNRQVIPEAAIMATRQPQDVVGKVHRLNGAMDEQKYGLGWVLEDYSGHHLVMHNGGVNGYVTSVTLVPQDHLGIIVLTNTDKNELHEALRWEVLDAYFGMPYHDYSGAYLKIFKANAAKAKQRDKELKDSVATNPLPSVALAYYTGKYTNELYGGLTITRGDKYDLEIRFEHHPKMFARLQPLGGNRFYATFSDPTLGKAVFPFIFENGQITGVQVKVDDEIERGAYLFKKVE